MHNLHRHQIRILLLAAVLFLAPFFSFAQLNYRDFSQKELYFGITLGYNSSKFKVKHSQEFNYHDSINVLNSSYGPGFNLGIISNLKLGEYFDLRFTPALSFAEKNLDYRLVEDQTAKRTIESIYLNFPLTVRYKSDPVQDMRVYVLGGVKYGLDLASNAEARKADSQVKVGRHNISAEFGGGLQFFFPLFIFSPEIKLSHGLLNVHARDRNLQYSNVIDKLFTRTILISLHFEG